MQSILYDIHAHFIVEEEGVYDDSKVFNYGLAIDRVKILEKAYNEGKTLIIKDVECWSKSMVEMSKKLSAFTNAHLYLSPKNGTGFGWHQDDRDVYVMMQVGSKKFEVEMSDGSVEQYLLKSGDSLYIPYGHRHKAFTGDEKGSIHIGFGVWPKEITVKNTYEKFPVSISINL